MVRKLSFNKPTPFSISTISHDLFPPLDIPTHDINNHPNSSESQQVNVHTIIKADDLPENKIFRSSFAFGAVLELKNHSFNSKIIIPTKVKNLVYQHDSIIPALENFYLKMNGFKWEGGNLFISFKDEKSRDAAVKKDLIINGTKMKLIKTFRDDVNILLVTITDLPMISVGTTLEKIISDFYKDYGTVLFCKHQKHNDSKNSYYNYVTAAISPNNDNEMDKIPKVTTIDKSFVRCFYNYNRSECKVCQGKHSSLLCSLTKDEIHLTSPNFVEKVDVLSKHSREANKQGDALDSSDSHEISSKLMEPDVDNCEVKQEVEEKEYEIIEDEEEYSKITPHEVIDKNIDPSTTALDNLSTDIDLHSIRDTKSQNPYFVLNNKQFDELKSIMTGIKDELSKKNIEQETKINSQPKFGNSRNNGSSIFDGIPYALNSGYSQNAFSGFSTNPVPFTNNNLQNTGWKPCFNPNPSNYHTSQGMFSRFGNDSEQSNNINTTQNTSNGFGSNPNSSYSNTSQSIFGRNNINTTQNTSNGFGFNPNLSYSNTGQSIFGRNNINTTQNTSNGFGSNPNLSYSNTSQSIFGRNNINTTQNTSDGFGFNPNSSYNNTGQSIFGRFSDESNASKGDEKNASKRSDGNATSFNANVDQNFSKEAGENQKENIKSADQATNNKSHNLTAIPENKTDQDNYFCFDKKTENTNQDNKWKACNSTAISDYNTSQNKSSNFGSNLPAFGNDASKENFTISLNGTIEEFGKLFGTNSGATNGNASKNNFSISLYGSIKKNSQETPGINFNRGCFGGNY